MNILFRLLVASLIFSQVAQAQSPADDIRNHLTTLERQGALMLEGHRIITGEVLHPYYALRGYEPAWTDPQKAQQLLRLISTAPDHGLHREDFFQSTLLRLRAGSGDPAVIDLLLSEALIRYAYIRSFGKLNPASIDPDINFERVLSANYPPNEIMRLLMEADDLQAEIDTATNHGPWYQAMQSELSRLRDLVETGGWPRVSDGPTLRPGDQDSRIPALRHRLSYHSGISASIDNGERHFDDFLAAAVRRFQQDHALGVDGIVGAATIAAMNVPAAHRADQLRLSLERLRWVTGDVENKQEFVAVNIAGFRVYVIREGQLLWSSRAMVGKPYRQTPVFSGRMAYLEFNPDWTVPPGIHRNDILPAVKRDSGYLARKHMEVFTPAGAKVDPDTINWSRYQTQAPYIFRQKPGPWNALGQVKFIFPNSHFVFLHDTPNRELFNRSSRAFSSGCIRVENPMQLAEILLEDAAGWDRPRIDQSVASAQTQRVSLKNRMPVYLLYLTAAVDVDGSILYLEDVYDRDAPLLEAMNRPLRFDMPSTAGS